MKQLKQLAVLALIVVIVGCSGEDDPAPQIPQVPIPGIKLTEYTQATYSDHKEEGTRTEEFYYDTDNRLTRHLTKQVFTVTMNGYVDTDSLQFENTVTYAPDKAIIIDTFGNISVYILNQAGYATNCTRMESAGTFIRNYTFRYSADSQLTEVTETLDNNVWSRITLQPTSETTATLAIMSGGGIITNTFQLILGERNTSCLPWLYLTEQHPLKLHQEAMYAQLLGKAPELLIQSIAPEEGNEKTTYSYTTDKMGELASCKESTRNSGYTYTRTVKYSINRSEH